MKLPFRVFALCHSLRRMASLPLSFYGGLKFMRLFLQAMHTSTAEKLLSDHTSAPVCAHLLTSIFLDNPKSANLMWVQDSSMSTLSPTETKQTDVE